MKRVTTTTKKHQIVLSGKEFLERHGKANQPRPWPNTAEVRVRVPSGGCYSGELVELAGLEIQLSWTETAVEEDEA